MAPLPPFTSPSRKRGTATWGCASLQYPWSPGQFCPSGKRSCIRVSRYRDFPPRAPRSPPLPHSRLTGKMLARHFVSASGLKTPLALRAARISRVRNTDGGSALRVARLTLEGGETVCGLSLNDDNEVKLNWGICSLSARFHPQSIWYRFCRPLLSDPLCECALLSSLSRTISRFDLGIRKAFRASRLGLQ